MDKFRQALAVELYDAYTSYQVADSEIEYGTTVDGEAPGGLSFPAAPIVSAFEDIFDRNMPETRAYITLNQQLGDHDGRKIISIAAKIEAPNLLHLIVRRQVEQESFADHYTYAGRFLVHWKDSD